MTALPTPQGPIAAAITATLKQSLQPTHLEGSPLPTPHPHPTPLVSCTPSDAPPLPLPQWSTRATCTAFLRLQKRTSGAAARHKLRARNLHPASHFPSPMLHRVVVGQCQAHVQSPLGLRDPQPPPLCSVRKLQGRPFARASSHDQPRLGCLHGQWRSTPCHTPRTPCAMTCCLQVHALAISAFTPQQWTDRGGVTTSSPACMGGMKAELRAAAGGHQNGSDSAAGR